MKKKAQAGQAAALVGVIALLMIFYILFLPQEEREELLGENGNGDNGEDGNGEEEDIVLLSEDVGRLDYLKDDEFEISLPAFTLYKTTEAKELKKVNPFYIRNGWFDKKTAIIDFRLDEENVDNVLLSFNAKIHKGILTIKLNDMVIFENIITTVNVEPVSLPKEYLVEDNVIALSVSGVGLAFWRTNEYNLESVRIIGDITDISGQESRNSFYIEDWKYNSLEKATLKFDPECEPDDVGVLDIDVNRINVYSGIPDCGILNRHIVSPGVLNAGTNNVVFKTNKGSYLVDLIKVVLNLEEARSPVYYFEVNESEFERVDNNTFDAILYVEFVDDDENKEADLIINGHKTRIDQDEAVYDKNIDSWIEEGNNYIEIDPKTTLEIVNLEVILEEND